METAPWSLRRLTFGSVRLRVRQRARSVAFYRDLLGLTEFEAPQPDVVRLGAPGGRPFLELLVDPSAEARPARAAGLYHVAVLFPDRVSLGQALRRLLAADWPFDGFADHLVSEALYLRDPDGNGIELYADRPRATWRWEGGQVAMATLPLDLDDLLADAGSRAEAPPPAETTVGHVHLQVSDLAGAMAFFAGHLHLEVTQRGFPGALFFAAGGYHHHVGTNVWAGRGVPQAPAGAVGLVAYEALLAPQDHRRLVRELEAAGVGAPVGETAWGLPDPTGAQLVLRTEGDLPRTGDGRAAGVVV